MLQRVCPRANAKQTILAEETLAPVGGLPSHAQAHDHLAVLAYCGSPDVARRIIRDIPPFVFSDSELIVTRVDVGKE